MPVTVVVSGEFTKVHLKQQQTFNATSAMFGSMINVFHATFIMFGSMINEGPIQNRGIAPEDADVQKVGLGGREE